MLTTLLTSTFQSSLYIYICALLACVYVLFLYRCILVYLVHTNSRAQKRFQSRRIRLVQLSGARLDSSYYSHVQSLFCMLFRSSFIQPSTVWWIKPTKPKLVSQTNWGSYMLPYALFNESLWTDWWNTVTEYTFPTYPSNPKKYEDKDYFSIIKSIETEY